MKNTELVFILDRSGSMAGREEDVVGGFNATISEQKEKGTDTLVTTYFFSDRETVIHDRIGIEEVPALRTEDFRVGGCTALIDTIGKAISHISDIHKYIREEDRPLRTLFVIMTDGLENASYIYSSDEVKKMIEAKRESGWEFLFMGANIDAVETASHIGIRADRSVNYHNDKGGIHKNFSGVSKFMDVYFDTEADAPTVEMSLNGGDWRKEMDEDFKSRS